MPSDHTREPLRAGTRWRGWAVADLLYGLAIIGLFVRWVPWRTPACNVVALLYGLGHLGLLPWLVRGRRVALWPAVALSLAGLFLGLLALAGLLFSWAYLRVTFGSFGAGASIVCLLLAVVVANVGGLYPTLRLLALVRWARARDDAEARAAPSSSRGGAAISAVAFLLLGLPSMALGATALDVTLRGRLVLRRAWSRTDVAPVLEVIAQEAPRDASTRRQGCEAVVSHARWEAVEDLRWSAFSQGARIWATKVGGPPRELCRALGSTPPASTREASFWLLERVVGRRLLPGHASPWLTLGLVPGLDGAEGASGQGGFSAIDAVADARFGVAPILPALPEVRFGLDAGWAAARLPVDELWSRVRYESWLWSPKAAKAWPVVGGRALGDLSLTHEALVEGAGRAAAYLVRAQNADGRFRYQVDMRTGAAADPFDDAGYNLSRHAGTTAALGLWAAQQHERLDASVAAAAIRGADWLLGQRPAGGFVSWSADEARLGENALALVAFLAVARASEDSRARFEGEARALAEKLQSLVQADGQMIYLFDPATRAAHPARRPMFEAEEAAYALMLSARQLGVPAFGASARRILDELLHRKDRYFLGWFVYGADAWTCLAVEAGWPEHVPSDGLDHCRGYASFLRRMQDDGKGPFPDRRGQYGFSEVLVPQTPATAGFGEAVLATTALARRLGVSDPALEEQARRGLEALLREQVRAETAFLAREPSFVDGGFTRSSVEPEIRVDFVQHALSALMWGASLIPPTQTAFTPPRSLQLPSTGCAAPPCSAGARRDLRARSIIERPCHDSSSVLSATGSTG